MTDDWPVREEARVTNTSQRLSTSPSAPTLAVPIGPKKDGVSLATRVRRIVGPLLANDWSGRAIAAIFRDRIPHRGLTIDTSDPVVTPSIKAALLLRGYESAEYRFAQAHLPRDIDVIELGGSIGVISCILRRHILPARSLTVIEADPRLARVLRGNLARNGCSTGANVRQVAISYGGGENVRFAVGATSVSGRVADAATAETAVLEVPARTLAQIVTEAGVSDYAIVSDIEGVEWDVFAHDLDTLAGARVVIMETHGRAGYGSHEEFIARLLATGRFTLLAQHGAVIALRGTAGA